MKPGQDIVEQCRWKCSPPRISDFTWGECINRYMFYPHKYVLTLDFLTSDKNCRKNRERKTELRPLPVGVSRLHGSRNRGQNKRGDSATNHLHCFHSLHRLSATKRNENRVTVLLSTFCNYSRDNNGCYRHTE